MPIPDYQQLMLPVLKVAAEGEVRVPGAAIKIADEIGLTLAERQEMLPSGKVRLLHSRIHWAKFYLVRAGLVVSPGRGRFTASAAGRALLSSNPASIDIELLTQYPAFVSFYQLNKRGIRIMPHN